MPKSSTPVHLSPEAFMQACRDGGSDIETWLRVLDREHGARFYREAAMALKSWHAAEDVVQDALIKVWQRCASFRGMGDPLAWVHQIVRHTLLDALGRRTATLPLTDDDGQLTPSVQAAVAEQSLHAGNQPDEHMAEQQVEAVFRRCFERFATDHPQHAQVLRWVVDEGLDNRAVQQLLNRSPGATREFISQCRKKARPYFQAWYQLVSRAAQADASATWP